MSARLSRLDFNLFADCAIGVSLSSRLKAPVGAIRLRLPLSAGWLTMLAPLLTLRTCPSKPIATRGCQEIHCGEIRPCQMYLVREIPVKSNFRLTARGRGRAEMRSGLRLTSAHAIHLDRLSSRGFDVLGLAGW